MRFHFLLVLLAGAVLAACAPSQPLRMGPDGKPVSQVYRDPDPAQVRYRMVDAVNALREARGAPPLELNAELTAAAATHSRDMSVQERPWHFGSDGSSPLERARRAGYQGELLGEVISETFETELQTLTAWMEEANTRNVIVNPRARDMGFAFHQDPNGKLWWTLVTGDPRGTPTVPDRPAADVPVSRGPAAEDAARSPRGG